MPQETASMENSKALKAVNINWQRGGLRWKISTTFSGLIFVLGLLVIGIGDLMGDRSANAGVMATMKTVILAMAAAALAWAGRSPRFVEFGWIAYGVLGLGGLKILFQDFPNSRPSTLFIALAVYGAALILVPWISRRTTR